MFDPRLIFFGLWLSQVVGQVIFRGDFYPFSHFTWVIVGCAVMAFLAGGQVGAWMPIPTRVITQGKNDDINDIRLFAYIALSLYLVVSVVGGIAAYHLITASIDSIGGKVSLEQIRIEVISDFSGDRKIFNILRIFYFGVGLCVFLLAYAKRFSKIEILLIILLGIVSAIATTGRLYLLLFFIASAALFYRQRLITNKWVLAFGAGFLGLFVAIALLMNKGDVLLAYGENRTQWSVLSQIGWNIKVYMLGSLACFNHFVTTDVPRIEGGVLLPNFVRTMLDTFGATVPPKPLVWPMAYVPLRCNTYTVLFPLFHDGWLFGVLAGLFTLGLLHQYIFRLHVLSESPVVWYAFAISLYPLFMSIFDDAYFSSPLFWLILWAPPVLYIGARHLLRIPKCQRSFTIGNDKPRR